MSNENYKIINNIVDASGINSGFINDNYNAIDKGIINQMPQVFNTKITYTTSTEVDENGDTYSKHVASIESINSNFIYNTNLDYNAQIDVNLENYEGNRDAIEEIYENYSKIKTILVNVVPNEEDNKVIFSFIITLYETEILTTEIPIKVLITPIFKS